MSSSRQIFWVSTAALGGLVFGVWWYFGFSLEFMKFFAAEPNVVVPQADAPRIASRMTGVVSCSPDTQATNVGVGVLVTASGSSPFQWIAPNAKLTGTLAAPGQISNIASVSYAKRGTKIIVVQALRGDGSKKVDSVACTVVVKP